MEWQEILKLISQATTIAAGAFGSIWITILKIKKALNPEEKAKKQLKKWNKKQEKMAAKTIKIIENIREIEKEKGEKKQCEKK